MTESGHLPSVKTTKRIRRTRELPMRHVQDRLAPAGAILRGVGSRPA
jgi:hypothetical protein